MRQVFILLVAVFSLALLVRWLQAEKKPADAIRVELNEDHVTLGVAEKQGGDDQCLALWFE